jgi:hypothetical protein
VLAQQPSDFAGIVAVVNDKLYIVSKAYFTLIPLLPQEPIVLIQLYTIPQPHVLGAYTVGVFFAVLSSPRPSTALTLAIQPASALGMVVELGYRFYHHALRASL